MTKNYDDEHNEQFITKIFQKYHTTNIKNNTNVNVNVNVNDGENSQQYAHSYYHKKLLDS